MLIIGHGVFYVMREKPQMFPTAKIQRKRQTTKPFNKDLNNLKINAVCCPTDVRNRKNG